MEIGSLISCFCGYQSLFIYEIYFIDLNYSNGLIGDFRILNKTARFITRLEFYLFVDLRSI